MLSLPSPPGMVMSWKASLAIVFLELWQIYSTPHRMLFCIYHSFYWFVFVCTICSSYLLAHRQKGQIHAKFSLWYCYKKKIKMASISKSDCFLLLVSVKLEHTPSWRCGWRGHRFDSKILWPWRLFSPKTTFLMGSYSRRSPLMFLHGNKGVSPPEEEIYRNIHI